MILAADVLDQRGRLLVPSGKELSEKHVRALPAWGVTRLEIEGDDVEGVLEVEPWAMDEAAAQLEKLFSRVNREHPLIAALHPICVARRATAIQEAGAGGSAE